MKIRPITLLRKIRTKYSSSFVFGLSLFRGCHSKSLLSIRTEYWYWKKEHFSQCETISLNQIGDNNKADDDDGDDNDNVLIYGGWYCPLRSLQFKLLQTQRFHTFRGETFQTETYTNATDWAKHQSQTGQGSWKKRPNTIFCNQLAGDFNICWQVWVRNTNTEIINFVVLALPMKLEDMRFRRCSWASVTAPRLYIIQSRVMWLNWSSSVIG